MNFCLEDMKHRSSGFLVNKCWIDICIWPKFDVSKVNRGWNSVSTHNSLSGATDLFNSAWWEIPDVLLATHIVLCWKVRKDYQSLCEKITQKSEIELDLALIFSITWHICEVLA